MFVRGRWVRGLIRNTSDSYMRRKAWSLATAPCTNCRLMHMSVTRLLIFFQALWILSKTLEIIHCTDRRLNPSIFNLSDSFLRQPQSWPELILIHDGYSQAKSTK
ncbi:hypothetical protein PgNI_06280 [Pyricularia grisea]|uniref:Uncharacterized protein n=1 Tax=Pyricularia grisea TaxID=148305 RepID=A0A6P8B434_PYRGI|nr:hypothetical protein PgNI_06280 [Pyricularia grisea]TLD10096.1 hypothetical protein PgNI_06280 [Pyricularia grisea]